MVETRSMLYGKWVAEGKAKGYMLSSRTVGSALKTGNVLAFLHEIFPLGDNKGGTVDFIRPLI